VLVIGAGGLSPRSIFSTTSPPLSIGFGAADADAGAAADADGAADVDADDDAAGGPFFFGGFGAACAAHAYDANVGTTIAAARPSRLRAELTSLRSFRECAP
jgi:hypothetical protein